VTYSKNNKKKDSLLKVEPYIYSLNSINPNDSLNDLKILKQLIGEASIVGMGEATHGTSEFFKIKHRVFRFLVEEMNFKVFAIEASFGEANRINEYILEGKGDLEKLIWGMGFWTWATEEVRDMITWMRMYNKNKKPEKQIKFYGFDMQYNQGSIEWLSSFIKKNIQQQNDLLLLIDKYKGIQFENVKTPPNLIIDTLNILKNKVIVLEDEIIKNSSIKEFELALKYIDVLIQDAHLEGLKIGQRFDQRDKDMAQNIEWIFQYEDNKKMLLWAHNGHITEMRHFRHAMGEHLHRRFKNDYYSIVFEFNYGQFNAINYPDSANRNTLREFSLDQNSLTLGFLLSQFGYEYLLLNIKDMSNKNYLIKDKQNLHHIGAVFSENWIQLKNKPYLESKIKLKKYCDSIIFVNHISSTKMLNNY